MPLARKNHVKGEATSSLQARKLLIDDGFSARKGEHLSHGKLGRFLAEADKGTFKGCALVVEQPDRVSRLGIDQTHVLCRRLLTNGITVHISQENRAISLMLRHSRTAITNKK